MQAIVCRIVATNTVMIKRFMIRWIRQHALQALTHDRHPKTQRRRSQGAPIATVTRCCRSLVITVLAFPPRIGGEHSLPSNVLPHRTAAGATPPSLRGETQAVPVPRPQP